MRPENTERTPALLSVIAAQIGTALDNTKSYQEALHLAERDALTGLFNHRGIHKRLAGESLRAQQSHTELSLIMIDMDDFKVLNDTYGHPVGDSVLRHLSDSIRASAAARRPCRARGRRRAAPGAAQHGPRGRHATRASGCASASAASPT